MKILIVEDQQAKAQEIAEFLKELIGGHLDFARSFIEARDILASDQFDWVILDMAIPFEAASDVGVEEDIEALGGRLLLREMRANSWFANIVIVTQYPVFDPGGERITFDDLKIEAEENFSRNYRGIVFYRRGLSQWKTQLKEIILNEGADS